MLRDALILMVSGAGSYLWLCANTSPLASSARSLLRSREDRTAWAAFGLASSGALLWTVVAVGAIVLGTMLEPAGGQALFRSDLVWRGVTLGSTVWVCQLLASARVPRFGPTFEIGTALALVAIVNDDPWRLARVERLYRTHAAAEVTGPSRVSASMRRVAA